VKIHVKGGHFIDPANGIDAPRDLYIAAGKVVAVGTAPDGFTANRTLDASGCVVAPGLIDLSVRLREPGFEYKATLESEMAAAVAGGVTSLACPPDTDPPLDEPGLVEMLKFRARSLNQAKVFPLGALTLGLAGATLTEMAELTDAGCIGFAQADAAVTDTLVLMRALQYAATFGYSVWLRPEDGSLAKAGVAHDGEVATRLGLSPISPCAETVAVSAVLLLARETGARVHLCRLSTREGLEMVRRAKADGMSVTCDVSANHVHLSELDLGYFDSNCHLRPPLRSVRDRDALRQGLLDGTVDAICSDHTPVDDDAKQRPFAESEPGATGLELLLPLSLKWARECKVPLARAVSLLTTQPARILGLDLGRLCAGHVADVCVFDPDQEWTVEPRALRSQGKNTPFLGLEVLGRVRWTLVDGQIVHEG
jgi:dihydroorotase